MWDPPHGTHPMGGLGPIPWYHLSILQPQGALLEFGYRSYSPKAHYRVWLSILQPQGALLEFGPLFLIGINQRQYVSTNGTVIRSFIFTENLPKTNILAKGHSRFSLLSNATTLSMSRQQYALDRSFFVVLTGTTCVSVRVAKHVSRIFCAARLIR